MKKIFCHSLNCQTKVLLLFLLWLLANKCEKVKPICCHYGMNKSIEMQNNTLAFVDKCEAGLFAYN